MWTKLVWPPSSHLYHDCLMSRLCTNLVPKKQSTKDNKIYNLLKTLKRNCVWQRSSLMRVTMLIGHTYHLLVLFQTFPIIWTNANWWNAHPRFHWLDTHDSTEEKKLLEEVTSNKLYNYKRKPYHRWCIFKNEPFHSLNEPKRNFPLQYQSER